MAATGRGVSKNNGPRLMPDAQGSGEGSGDIHVSLITFAAAEIDDPCPPDIEPFVSAHFVASPEKRTG